MENDENPISKATRGKLYLAGIIIGGLATVSGPLMIALETPQVWVAVTTSGIGAVTSLLNLLSRANLSDGSALPARSDD